MNRTLTSVALVIAFVGAVSFVERAYGGIHALPELRISPSRVRFVAGEPIVVKVEVKNSSSEPMPSAFADNEDFSHSGDVVFRVTGDGGVLLCEERATWVHGIRPGIYMTKPQLRPNGSLTCERMFLPRLNLDQAVRGNAQGEVPLLPIGRYELKAELSWSPPGAENSSLMSEGILFDTVEPTGVDIKAAKLMTSSDVGPFFAGIHGGSPPAITELITRYPESTYARYARLRLMIDRERRIWNTSPELSPQEKSDLKSLLAEALDCVDTTEDIGLHDNVLLYSARLARKLDDENQSIQILERLIAEYPQGDSVQAAKESLMKWQRVAPLKDEPLGIAHHGNKAWLLLAIGGLAAVAMLCLILLLRKRALKT